MSSGQRKLGLSHHVCQWFYGRMHLRFSATRVQDNIWKLLISWIYLSAALCIVPHCRAAVGVREFIQVNAKFFRREKTFSSSTIFDMLYWIAVYMQALSKLLIQREWRNLTVLNSGEAIAVGRWCRQTARSTRQWGDMREHRAAGTSAMTAIFCLCCPEKATGHGWLLTALELCVADAVEEWNL